MWVAQMVDDWAVRKAERMVWNLVESKADTLAGRMAERLVGQKVGQ